MSKSLFSKKETVITDINRSVITVGEKNLIIVSQNLSEIQETSLTREGEDWRNIVGEISALQKIVRNLPDEYEYLRDQELIPILSKTKNEAKNLSETPKGNKEVFVEDFKSFCDIASKAADIAIKVSPLVIAISKLAGVPIP